MRGIATTKHTCMKYFGWLSSVGQKVFTMLELTSSSPCVSAYRDITKHTQQAHNALGHAHGRWQSESCLVSGLAGAQEWHRHGVFDELCTYETRTSGPAMCPAGTAKPLKPGHTHFTLTHLF